MSTLSIQRLQNILDLMGLMLIQSIRSNYNVNPNTKYSNYIEHRIKCLNYSRIRFFEFRFLYFFDVFISCRKWQDTLQLNTCVKYCVCRHCRDKRSQVICLECNVCRYCRNEKKINKITLLYICLFIYYVDTLDTTFTEYTRFNGTYVDTVDTIKLQCKS